MAFIIGSNTVIDSNGKISFLNISNKPTMYRCGNIEHFGLPPNNGVLSRFNFNPNTGIVTFFWS